MNLLPAFVGVPEVNRVYQVDLFTLCAALPDQSVDMILCDLPYGTTACSWDTAIPFEPMWKAFKRVIKPKGAIVLTASEPFKSLLVVSNLPMFRYDWMWDKVNRYTGYGNANFAPLRVHESVLVFYQQVPIFNKQYRIGQPYRASRTGGYGQHMRYVAERPDTINNGLHNPCSIIAIEADNKLEAGIHPTQKPVPLFRYLIRTYTQIGDLILDPCVGSGTTAIAAREEGRQFICGDNGKDEKTGKWWSEIATERLAQPYTLPMFAVAGAAD